MSTINRKFETLDEMVQYVVSLPGYDAAKKWHLNISNKMVYVDEVASTAWEAAWKLVNDAWNKLPYEARYEDADVVPGDPNFMLKVRRVELLKSRPEQKSCLSYYFYKSSRSWRGSGTSIDLSQELGSAIMEAFKNSKTKSGRNTVTGIPSARGLQGWIKLLGKTNIGDEVKQAQAAAEMLKAKKSRNYARTLVGQETGALMAQVENAVRAGVMFDPKHYSNLLELMFAATSSIE